MRWLFAAVATLSALPAWADGAQCVLPDSMAASGVTLASQAAASQQPGAPPTSTAVPEADRSLSDTSRSPPLPFIERVAGSGATIIDLGVSHGLRLTAARSGDEFRVFSVLLTGEAAVEGAPVDLSPTQLERVATGNVTKLAPTAGFRGYFVRSGASFQVFYATPDGLALIPGVLRDAQGKNLTRAQVAEVPGTIPTVEVVAGRRAQPGGFAGSPPPTAATFAIVEKAESGAIGPDTAPRLFMLVDPQCIYSVRAFQQLRGFAQAGKIRLAVIPLSVLDYEDHGQSTRSALALLSKPTDQIVTAWQSGDVAGTPSPNAAAKLRANMAIAEAIGLKGTPTFVWRRPDGSIGRVDGMPPDISALVASVGG